MKNAITINKYLLVGLIIAALAGGSYAGFFSPLSIIRKEKRASCVRKPRQMRKISFARRASSAVKLVISRVIISFLSVARKKMIVKSL